VPYQVIFTLDELLAYESTTLSQGYEGVILRSPDGLYKNGRTTLREGTYLRIKRFTQEDAVVLSLVEAMENTNEAVTNALGRSERSAHQDNLVPKGMIGSLICRDVKTDQEITVGPGKLTHEERTYYWSNPSLLVGRTISYKFFPHGQLNLPRFPTFESIRITEDLVQE
jgi:DNA ligase-1